MTSNFPILDSQEIFCASVDISVYKGGVSEKRNRIFTIVCHWQGGVFIKKNQEKVLTC